MTALSNPFDLRHAGRDLRAGIVVFFVAIPLCLGIAIASGAPPISGLIAGMVGGLVISIASGSQLSVSGPAAGLTVIVLAAIEEFGYGGLLFATLLAGALQALFGVLRFGGIGAFVPSGVIKGMRSAIGLILIATQIPLALGHGAQTQASLATPKALLAQTSPLALTITVLGLAILLLFESRWVQQRPWLRMIPAPLLVVAFGIAISTAASLADSPLALDATRHVQLPSLDGPVSFFETLRLPDFSHWMAPGIYLTAVTIALVASLETLLSIEAVDDMDPLGRTSPPNRELRAQGLGNMVSGLIGGLPITAVIVRSSANVQLGGRTRLSSFVHGVLLTGSVAFLAFALEQIPLACLAAILLHTGYKLARPALVMAQYRRGWQRFIPFVITIGAILVTGLLEGVLIGLLCATYFLVRANYRTALSFTRSGDHALLRLNTEVSFLNRQQLRAHLADAPANGTLIIDASATRFIDPDIREDIDRFVDNAGERGITVELKQYDGVSATYPDPARLHEPAGSQHAVA
jgi:MFS superfamily sulfate permease-like transporter